MTNERPALPVRPAELPISSPTNLTLADVVRLAQRLDTVRVLVALRPVWTDAGSVGAPDVLVAHKAGDAGAAVEGAVRVDADRVLHAAPVVLVALVDVVTNLFPRRCIKERGKQISLSKTLEHPLF